MPLRVTCVVLGAIGCGSVTASNPTEPRDAMASDASVDATVICDPMAPFKAPVAVPGVATDATVELAPRLSADELTIYFWGEPQSNPDSNIYVAHRAKRTDPFDDPMPVPSIDTTALENDPAISSDGNTLWFTSNRPTGKVYHLYVATRATSLAQFGAPGLVDGVNAADTTQSDVQPFVTADGSELWFASSRPPSQLSDIWHASWNGTSFANPVQEVAVSSAGDDFNPTLSADRLTLYFSSTRAATGAPGGFDVWRSHRSVASDGFPAPSLVDELSTTGRDYATWLSPDNCRIYGSRTGAVNDDVFMATRQP